MIRNSCFEIIITRGCIFLNKNLKNHYTLLLTMLLFREKTGNKLNVEKYKECSGKFEV